MKASTWKRGIGLILIAGVIGVGVWWRGREASATQYQTAALTRGDIESVISATGTCNAVVTVQVGSQVSGNIKALYADFNTKVTQGQIVALIDPETFQAKVNQAQANQDNARASVLNAKAMIARSDADIASAKAGLASSRANVAKAEALLTDANSKRDRSDALFKRGFIAKEDLETAQTTSDSAAASVKAAEAQADASEHAIKAVEAQRKVAEAQLESALAQTRQIEATVNQAEIDLKHTEIKAPVDGTVIARRMDVGQTVAASFQAPTIFEIAQDLMKMQVDTNVDEADIGRVRVGQRASFTVDAYPGQTFVGEAVQIRQAPINVQNVITYDVVVAVSNPDLKLFPGMTANVRILTDRRENVLKLPSAALRVRMDDIPGIQAQASPEARGAAGPRRGEGGAPAARGEGGWGKKGAAPDVSTVWLLDANGKPQPQKVKLGISDGAFSALEDDSLHEGDKVIVGVITKKPASAPMAGLGAPVSGGGTGGRSREMRF